MTTTKIPKIKEEQLNSNVCLSCWTNKNLSILLALFITLSDVNIAILNVNRLDLLGNEKQRKCLSIVQLKMTQNLCTNIVIELQYLLTINVYFVNNYCQCMI